MREHPLFPAPDDDSDPPDVGYIHVTRIEGGAQRWCARRFGAEEIGDLEALHELFGGGHFELIARGSDGRRITARQRYTLDGRAKPLNPTGDETTAPAAAAPAQHGGATVADLLPLMLQWMQHQQSAAAERDKAQTQLMIALLSDSKQSANAHVQAMAGLHQSFATAQSELLTRVLGAQGGGGAKDGGAETFIRGIEFAQQIQAGKEEAIAEDAEVASTIGSVVEGFKTFAQYDLAKESMKVNGAAPPSPPTPPTPPKTPPAKSP